jgi:hypothetical protein
MTLPYNNDLPTQLANPPKVPNVTVAVIRKFFLPKVGSCLRQRTPRFALMPVPETTVNEDHNAFAREDEVRCSR